MSACFGGTLTLGPHTLDPGLIGYTVDCYSEGRHFRWTDVRPKFDETNCHIVVDLPPEDAVLMGVDPKWRDK